MSTTAVLCYPTHGHVAPKLAVVEELVRRGERVVYYSTEESRTKIEATGAEFCPYDHPYHAFDPTPPTEGLFSDMERLLKLTQTMLPELLSKLRALQPDYLLLDSKSVWGNLAGQILGLPAVTLSVVFALDPKLVTADYLVPRLYGGATEEILQRALLHLHGYFEIAQELNDSYQVHSPNVIEFLGNPQPLNIIFTSRLFQLAGEQFDERYQFVGPSIGTRVEPADFPFDRLGTAPLVYISMGTVFNDLPEFYRACFAALADLSCQVVMPIGRNLEPQVLGEPPANFLLCEYAPQLQLLEQAALFVTHGGMNSANEGLLYGVPLLVVPQRGDQYMVAGQVAELGAGLPLFPHEVTPERLQGMVAHILGEPGFQQQAQRVGQSLRDAGGYQRAADEICAFKERMGIR
ncbi:glycosyl transferase family 1 [Chloroflexi bacterium TSY]|nr:glycosyl transferase family 1 [Chloroflexi bacterium TSY]WAB21636.1 glycosyl Transferase 3 AtsK [Chloroflexota bacterium]